MHPNRRPPRPTGTGVDVDRCGSVELGGFRLVRVLGEGGFGTAYLAEQLGLGRLAVVKVLRRSLLESPRRDAILARFDTEVRAATRLHHPNLCTVYTVDRTSDGAPAVAMEFIDGEILRSRLERLAGHPMAVAELVPLFRQLVGVVRAVHAQRIRHGDLSPNNVMLTMDHDGQRLVKLVDFGIASLLDSSDADFAAGTPGYSAPEQFRGETTTASDLFGLGALLFWAATGHELFAGVAPEDIVAETNRWQLGANPHDVNPAVPAGLAALIRGLLDPAPGMRPSLDEILEELDALVTPQAKSVARRVLIVDGAEPIAPLVGAQLAPYGVRIAVTADPRRATRSEGEFAAIVINASLTAPRAAAIHAHLAEFLPEVPVLVVALGTAPVAWDDVPFRDRVRLPGGGYRLIELGETLRARRAAPAHPAAAAVSQSDGVPLATARTYLSGSQPSSAGHPTTGSGPTAAYEAFLGAMPELLLELEAAIGAAELPRLAERVAGLARAARVREVEALATMIAALGDTGELLDPTSLISDLSAAFIQSVRARTGLR